MRRLVLPLVAAALAFVPLPAHFVERVYAVGWYTHLQPLLTGVSNAVPFAWLDPLVALTAGAMLIGAAWAWRRAGGPWWRRFANVVILALQAGAFLYVAFLVLWGFNYRRAPAVERLHVSPERVTADRLVRLASRAVAEVNALHDPARSRAGLRGDVLVATMAPAFAQAQGLLGSRWRMTPGRPKASFIGRTFPLSGVDGMINPFGLEVILNPEVLPFERPYVLAHEWAHLAGHAPESEASFVAFLACLQGSRGDAVQRLAGPSPARRSRPAPSRTAGHTRSDWRRALAPTCAPSRPACAASSLPFTTSAGRCTTSTCAQTASRAAWPITARC